MRERKDTKRIEERWRRREGKQKDVEKRSGSEGRGVRDGEKGGKERGD